jgi:hypothetical protein
MSRRQLISRNDINMSLTTNNGSCPFLVIRVVELSWNLEFILYELAIAPGRVLCAIALHQIPLAKYLLTLKTSTVSWKALNQSFRVTAPSINLPTVSVWAQIQIKDNDGKNLLLKTQFQKLGLHYTKGHKGGSYV